MATYRVNKAAVSHIRHLIHKDVELAAHRLLQYLDKATG